MVFLWGDLEKLGLLQVVGRGRDPHLVLQEHLALHYHWPHWHHWYRWVGFRGRQMEPHWHLVHRYRQQVQVQKVQAQLGQRLDFHCRCLMLVLKVTPEAPKAGVQSLKRRHLALNHRGFPFRQSQKVLH